jgi:hypothetical protein
MSDVITLANKIAKYKEDIRKAIEARGVECDETTPLSQYAPKIGQIEAASEGGKIFYGKETDDTITSDMTSYTIPDVNYTVIDKGALSNYKNLETVSLTNAKYIDSSALAGNTALENVSAANAEYIGAGCFANDTSLKEISLPSAKKIKGEAFSGCSYLVSVDFPEAVELGANALKDIGDSKVTEVPATTISINMPKLETAGAYSLCGIDGLAELKLDSLKDLGTCGLAYNQNTNFTSLSLPNVENVDRQAFYYDNKLTNLELPSCKSLGTNALGYCTSLKTLTVGKDCYIGDYLTTQDIYSTGSSATSITKVYGSPSYIGAYAFYNCTNLTSIDCSSATYIGTYAFASSNLTSIDCSSATYIGNYAFTSSNLTSIDCSSATYIGDRAFYGCTNLTSIDCSSAKNIGNYALGSCKNLTSIDCSSATYIGIYAFTDCTKLKKVWIPSTCTTIGSTAFNNNPNSCTLYTDATEKPSGWSSVPSNVVYGATHEDFENA